MNLPSYKDRRKKECVIKFKEEMDTLNVLKSQSFAFFFFFWLSFLETWQIFKWIFVLHVPTSLIVGPYFLLASAFTYIVLD